MHPPTPRRILLAALVALCAGLAATALLNGFSQATPIRFLQGASLVGIAIFLIGGIVVGLGLRLADWRDPASEEDFEKIVERSERLARDGVAAEPDEMDFAALDPLNDEDFEELVTEALDDLPDLLRRALERNVAVVISDDGHRHRAYGLYMGGTVARAEHDRIVVFRDTLRRDFGNDPETLRDEVTRTVRHELAHHLGADELGVRELGL